MPHVALIELVLGDITEQHVDVVVNAANSSLLGGGGVDGAIHRKGGPAILEDCRRLRAGHYGRGLRTGQAVATTAGLLPARWVVHTVGPVWSSTDNHWPAESAATIALTMITNTSKETPGITSVRLVLFDQRTYDVFKATATQ